MNIRFLIFSASIIFGFVSAFAGREAVDSVAVTEAADASVKEKQDSIATTELQEVIVTGDKAWIKDGVINVIPSKQEKKLSNSPETLIESMHLPFVQVKEGKITSISGHPVDLYINGEKASEIDVATFWPKQVNLVQYMENPKNAKFAGSAYVINFNMVEYKVGGVTRVDGRQKFPNSGDYKAASKLVKGKMTYGVMFDGSYSRDHSTSRSGETTYKDLFYGGRHYDEITRSEESRSYSRNDDLRFAAEAAYRTERMSFRTTFSLGWDRNPGSGSQSVNKWSQNLFNSESGSTYSRSRSLSPQFKGVFLYKFTDRWFLHIDGGYAYARNHSFSQSILGEMPPIDNSVVEDVNTINFRFVPSFSMSDKMTFNFSLDGNANWFSSLYAGSANTRQKQSRQEINGSFQWCWNPLQSIYVELQPGVKTSLWQIGNVKECNVSPSATAGVWWNPTRKIGLNASWEFFYFPVSASESNPVMVKYSELEWTIGNPHLKGQKSWLGSIRASYLPLNELNMSLNLTYWRMQDDSDIRYTSASKEYGGLIQETVNLRPVDTFHATLNINGSLLNGKLNIGVGPGYKYFHANEGGRRNMHMFRFNGWADYTLGNFRFSVLYSKNGKEYMSTGLGEMWTQDGWDFGVRYGTGNLYLDLRINDIFHCKQKSWRKYNSPHYSTYYDKLETGRSVRLNVTYTFGYGKKVDKSIDISGPESTTTSVRKVE